MWTYFQHMSHRAHFRKKKSKHNREWLNQYIYLYLTFHSSMCKTLPVWKENCKFKYFVYFYMTVKCECKIIFLAAEAFP